MAIIDSLEETVISSVAVVPVPVAVSVFPIGLSWSTSANDMAPARPQVLPPQLTTILCVPSSGATLVQIS